METTTQIILWKNNESISYPPPPPHPPRLSSDIVSPPLPLHPLSDPKIQASSCNERGVIFPQSLRPASASKHQLFQLSLTFPVTGWPTDPNFASVKLIKYNNKIFQYIFNWISC